MIRMHIQAIPSSNNKSQGGGGIKKAIHEYQPEKKQWAQWIWIMMRDLKQNGQLDGLTLPLQTATVILFYHFKSKIRRDPDNYSGKMINDGLVQAGLIKDDSFKDIDIFPMADFGNKSDSVEIILLEGKQIEQIVRKWIYADL